MTKNQVVSISKALSDTNRLRIIEMLTEGEKNLEKTSENIMRLLLR